MEGQSEGSPSRAAFWGRRSGPHFFARYLYGGPFQPNHHASPKAANCLCGNLSSEILWNCRSVRPQREGYLVRSNAVPARSSARPSASTLTVLILMAGCPNSDSTVWRHRDGEFALAFADGTRLFVD